MPISVKDAAALLGVSARKVYDLAAPSGPIPCYRIGRNINFDETDILEYKQQCRSVVTNRAVRSSLSSTASSTACVSALESAFRKLGVQPRLTNTTAKNQRASTQPRMALAQRTG
nr:helix-turn-helix domain-containing protein [Delftia sp. PS-11]